MKILFVTSNRIGDAVLSTSVLDYFFQRIDSKTAYQVTIACGPAAAPLFMGVPGLVQVIPLTKQKWAGHWFGLWRRCVFQRWDLVVDMRGSLLSYGLACKERIVSQSVNDGRHKVLQHADLVGVQSSLTPKLWTLDIHEQAAEIYIKPGDSPPLIIGPTANWIGKQWPAERFARVVNALTQKGGICEGAPVIVLGAPNEHVPQFFETLTPPNVQNLIGKVDLLTAYALMKRGRLYVGNDSGLMHMAAASGVPTLGLFGPSREQHYAPWGSLGRFVRTPESLEQIVARPDYDRHKPVSWMLSLSEDVVLNAAQTLLSETAHLFNQNRDIRNV